jgi:hypothetical protein
VTTADDQNRSEILANYRAQLNAMVEGDTAELGELLHEDFTLTHMTGYVQPKEEWLREMRAGQFVYNTAEEKNVSLEISGDSAHLIGRIVTDAKVYGMRANWRLQLVIDFSHTNGEWIATRSRATTW